MVAMVPVVMPLVFVVVTTVVLVVMSVPISCLRRETDEYGKTKQNNKRYPDHNCSSL
jgi:hypothetical protein